MGCTRSREDQPDEELAIIFAESALGLADQSEERLDYIVRKYSSANSINISQFGRIAEELRLHTDNYGPHSKIASFYDSWRNENGAIDRTEFLVLALLLCGQSAQSVGLLLFQCFEETAERTISIENLQIALEMVFQISLKTGNLVLNHQTRHSNEAKALRYVQKLKSAIPRAVETLVDAIQRKNGGAVADRTFVETLVYYRITSSSGCRAVLRNQLVSDVSNMDSSADVSNSKTH